MTFKSASNRKTLCLFLAVLAIAVIPMTSMADAQGGGEEGDREAAREHYKQGKALYDAGKFAEAEKEFQSAYDAQPHPVVLKSIAECRAALGNITGAVETLEKFLANSPRARVHLHLLAGKTDPAERTILREKLETGTTESRAVGAGQKVGHHSAGPDTDRPDHS